MLMKNDEISPVQKNEWRDCIKMRKKDFGIKALKFNYNKQINY